MCGKYMDNEALRKIRDEAKAMFSSYSDAATQHSES